MRGGSIVSPSTPEQSMPAASPEAAAPAFPAAGACAELLLAENKDAVYEGELKNLLREVLERGCGAHLLSQLLPELAALSSVLYHTLALGTQQPAQTLGEEFCDIMRVTRGASGGVQHVKLRRHALWLALAVLPRYLAARSQSGWKNLVQLTRTPRERMELQLRSRQEAAAAAAAASTGGSEGAQQSAERRVTPTRLLQTLDRGVSKLKALGVWLESDVFPASYEFSLDCVRQWGLHVHLAAFYVFAKYAHLSKRLADIQYVFVRTDTSPGINLSLLGYTMFLRLFATTFVELKRLRGHYKLERKQRQQEARAAAGNSGEVLLTHSTRVPTSFSTAEAPPSAETSSGSGAERRQRRRKCALCLGERVAPAATPCGHVFCWECVVGWCQKNKAECPLCRQETHPQQIKCIYNYV